MQTGEYSTSKKIELGIEKVDLNLLINRKDKFGEYAWSVISQIIKYSSSLVPGITDKFNDIDEAMRLGFNWSMGPFEMLKSIGVKNFFDRVGDVKGKLFPRRFYQKQKTKIFMVKDSFIQILKLWVKIKPKAIKIDKNKSADIFRFKGFQYC